MKPAKTPARGGRPSRAQAEQIHERILIAATELFLAQGYGATSVEAIAGRAGISKRTFYHRFDDKAELFAAVAHRLIQRMRPANEVSLFAPKSLKETLTRIGRAILQASLSDEALGLYRILLSEAARFPELARALEAEGTRQEAIRRIAELLKKETALSSQFAAEQFMQMILSTPQRRALGMGAKMSDSELDEWIKQTVELFLRGIKSGGSI